MTLGKHNFDLKCQHDCLYCLLPQAAAGSPMDSVYTNRPSLLWLWCSHKQVQWPGLTNRHVMYPNGLFLRKINKKERKKHAAIAGNSDSENGVILCGINQPISQHSRIIFPMKLKFQWIKSVKMCFNELHFKQKSSLLFPVYKFILWLHPMEHLFCLLNIISIGLVFIWFFSIPTRFY